MKKLIALLLTLVMVLSMAACGKSDTGAHSEKKENAGEQSGENDERIKSDGKQDEPYEPIQPDGPMFWYNRQVWERVPEGNCGNTLLSVNIPTPIDLKKIDEFCQPYYCYAGEFTSFADVIASDEIVLDERHDLYEIHPSDFSSNIYDGIDTIFLVWPDAVQEEDREVSAADCYENGWWYLRFETGIALLPGVENTYDNPTAQGDALLELLGAPSYGLYIPALDKDFETVLETNGEGSITGVLSYQLIYERDGYVLQLSVRDDSENGELEIDYFYYYPEEYWEMSQVYQWMLQGLYKRIE